MTGYKLTDIISWSGGTMKTAHAPKHVCRISTDSRTTKRGDLFLALTGDHFDGHAFVADAVQKGAAAVIVSKGRWTQLGAEYPVIRVRDTLRAYQNIAAGYRRTFQMPVVGITGSNGKTTTKEFIGALAGTRGRLVITAGTENNHVGVPLTLLKLKPKTELAVIEMGMNHPGEIRRLAGLAAPGIGVITNVSASHMKYMKSIDNIAKAKRELLQKMTSESVAVLNADEPYFPLFQKAAPGKIITFGLGPNADIRAENIRYLKTRIKCRLVIEPSGETAEVAVGLQGQYNVYNLLAAVAVCHTLGMDLAQVCRRLPKITLPPMRFEISRLSQMTFINDAYNANPESMKNSLAAFSAMSVKGRKIFVCGDMLELGSYSAVAHKKVGRLIAEHDVDYLITLGSLSQWCADAAERNGMSRRCIRSVESIEDVVQELGSIARPGDSILLKGSRGMCMEKILTVVKSQRYHKE